MYYDVLTGAVIADVHSIKLVMNIPLRTADQKFNVHKLIANPTWINGDKFVEYHPEYSYFGLSISKNDYILLTADDLRQCNSGSLRVCRLNIPLYDAQTLNCESSLYFQNERHPFVREVYFSIIKRPHCKSTEIRGYTTSQPDRKSPFAAPTEPAG